MKTNSLKQTVLWLCSAWLCAGSVARAAECASLSINALDHGWYDATGYHAPGNDIYICGHEGGNSPPLRNWFVFNIPVLTQPVASASLRLYTFDIITPSSETYELHQVTTSIAALRAGGSGLTSIYADLGDGPVYGSRTFLSYWESYQVVSIPLNAAFVSSLAAASGGTLALGGQVVTLDEVNEFQNEYLFGGSIGGMFGTNGFVQLVVNYSNASPLTIVQQPVSLTLPATDAATFQVQVCGGGAPAYQWQRAGTNLPGATSPFLQRLNVLPADAGSYRVLVTDSLTTVTSAVATLTVNAYAPTGRIYFSSGQSPALAGESVQFCASIFGQPIPTWRWQFNGTNLPAQNSSCLDLSNVQTNQSGSYRLVASNVFGAITSAPISLVVTQAAPTGGIYLAGGSLSPSAGSDVTLCATISGGPTPSMQWQFNGVNLLGQNFSCLYLSNVQSNRSGNYRLVASNAAGAFTSAPITLAVQYFAPTGHVYSSSGQSPALAGSYVYFCSVISGGPPPTYQWQLNDVNLPGRTGPCLELLNLSSNQAGLYRLVASNVVGVFTSAPIALAVSYLAPTGGVYFSSGQSPAPAGSYVTLCSSIFGAPYPSFRWQFNGVDMLGQNGFCIPGFPVSSNVAGVYRLIASNSVGVFTSAPIALAVTYFAPTGSIYFWIGQSPALAGSSVTLCPAVSAAPSPTYQWQFNGVNLPGENNGCLSLSSVSSNQAGLYSVVASNVVGVFTSAPIALVVNYSVPYGSISPVGVLPSMLAGSTVSICSLISGAPPPSYQWQFNGVNLPEQNSSCLYLYDAQTNQSGSYRLIASNSVGVFTSAVAVVVVIHAPPTATIYLSGGHTPTKVGSSLTLCSSVSGAPYPTVQWQFNGTNLLTETNSCLSLFNLQTNQSGGYSIMASNALGVVTSVVAMVSVVETAPVLAYFANGVPPLVVGSYQYLCAEVSLPEPATLQWRFNGTNLTDATNYCFFLYSLQASEAGEYSVVATTATSGIHTSPPIALTVYYAPPGSAYPYFILGSSSALVGEDVSLAAVYAGSPSFIQWRFNGVDLPGQTNGSLALLSVTTNQVGEYSFTATNIAGATTSSVVTIAVRYQPPIFAGHPFNQSAVEGATVRFPGYALAGPPPEYFLEQNGTNVAVPYTYLGCCGPSVGGFSLFDTTFADAGSYRIIASNFLGTATSAVATLTMTPAGPLDRWPQRNPLPQSLPILVVAHGTNQFVAVGDRGTILTSPDGANWALQNRRADLPLHGVAYGDGVFVAVGAGGTILSSSDGTNWAYRYTAAATELNAVTHAAGRFVVAGSAPGLSTLIMHSPDGINWERIPLNGFYAQQCVAYGNGLFIAAGSSSIIYSADAMNWSLARSVNRQLESVTYADGLYVVVGDDGSTLVSADGVLWAARTPITTRRLLGVTYGAGRFVAAGARGIMLTSTDTITWIPASSGTPDRLETIDYAGGIFVSAGENGTIITSTNGTSWTKQNFGITRDLDGMQVANGTIVVVGKGGSILTSTDGVHYTTQNAGLTNDLHGVTWGGGLWVAVGEPGIVLTSSNAVDWTLHDTGTTNSLKDATYAQGQWIAVGTQGTIVRSTDGVNWAATFVSADYGPNAVTYYDLNDVAYGNDVFLVAGDGPYNQNGSVFRSLDGVAWTQVNFFPGKNLRGVTFANGLFLFAANDGLLFRTIDGLSFTARQVLSGNYYGNLRAVTWAHGLWIVVGNSGGILTSPDLVTWTSRATRTFESLHQVALLDGRLVVIGNRGTILQSGRFVTELAPPAFVPEIGFRLPIQGVINRAYQIQASTNLVNWTSLLTFTNMAERGEFTDTNALQFPLRFYRLVEP